MKITKRRLRKIIAEALDLDLEVGDVILTGTPKGVGPLNDGDTVAVSLDAFFSLQTKVIV